MRGAVAAGHPCTTAAGARILAAGGNAVDACVAAALASWVAESPLTGPGAGGFALVVPADGRPARLADFFVATPGRGRPEDATEMHAVDVGFGGGRGTTQVFHVGEPSVAIPGAAAGLAALHRAYGSLPWRELVAPALELTRVGVRLSDPQAHLHAILDPILRRSPEGRRLYSRPGGDRLASGDLLRLDDLAGTIEQLAVDPQALYRGELADALARIVAGGGGRLTREDLARYRVVWRRPVRTSYLGHEVISNPPPSSGGVLIAYGLALLERLGAGAVGSAEALSTLVEVMREQTRARAERGFSGGLRRGGLARRLLADRIVRAALERIAASGPGVAEDAAAGGTTHISVLDGAGNAASLSCSTGSGSGVIVPGTGIHLNNMLGEVDLLAGAPAAPGLRLTSMMAPTVLLGPGGSPRLVVGSAGSARLRGAILQVIVNVVGHGLGVADAIDRPRVHVDEPYVHCEDLDGAALDRLAAIGRDVVRWRGPNLFFGGANAVEVLPDGRLVAAGDARRGGDGLVVEECVER